MDFHAQHQMATPDDYLPDNLKNHQQHSLSHHDHHGNDHHHDHDHGGGSEDAPFQEEHAHAHGEGGHVMNMYFHGGVSEVILFSFWRTDSVGGLAGSMAACVVLGILYEGLKSLRDALYANKYEETLARDEQEEEQRSERSRSQRKKHHRHSSGDDDDEESAARRKGKRGRGTRLLLRALETSMWSRDHLVQTLLHLVQVTLSYLLMLVFMTYNTWLCAATVVGLALGYFLFGWRRRAALLQQQEGARADCCH